VGKTDDSTSLKSTPLIEAERQVESFRQVREAHRMELVEDYVELISDLLADQDDVIRALHHMRFRGHDLIIFQVLDQSELDFDFDGQVRFREPETREEVQADPRAIRSAYQAEIRAFIDRYKRECQSVRADFVTVHNGMTFDKALIEFLAQREKRF